MTLMELDEIKKNYKVLELAVDFINPSYNISRAKHLDNSRYIACTLTENGIPRTVKKNEVARIRLQKPDKTYVYNDCDILEDGRVLITLTEQILAVEGNAVCDIQLVDEQTEIIYSTKNFIINIDKTAVNNSIIASSDEFNALNKLIATNKKLNEELKANEKVRQENENERIENENERKDNETDRQDAEAEREKAENTRKANETIRIGNENIRKANETVRQNQESDRQTNTATAISNAEKATKKANDATDDLQHKLDTHYFVLTEDKDVAGGVPSLDSNKKVPVEELYEATTSSKGITQLTDSVTSTSVTTAATSNSIKTANDRAIAAENELESKKADLSNPTFTGVPKAPTASAGTNTSQIATTAFVQTAISNGIAASDAMIIKGTIGTGGTVTTLPTTYKTGWTYRVVNNGTYAGQVCEIGDLIVALVDRNGSGNVDSDWCVAQTNINGAITSVKSGDAYLVVSQSGSVVTLTHKDVTRSDTTSTAVPAHSGTFTVIDSITSDVKGHITKVNLKTVTLPSAYSHPTATAYSSGLYKFTTDNLGHVTSVTTVTKEDIVALGIPANDNITYSNMTGATATTSGKAGLVPAPTVGKQDLFLRGDGTWADTIGKSGTGTYAEIFNSSTNIASGNYSHAEGICTTANGITAHAEGNTVTAKGDSSHAEGYFTKSIGSYSHAEGYYTYANNTHAHAEGAETIAYGIASHAEGLSTRGYDTDKTPCTSYSVAATAWESAKFLAAIGQGAHAEGRDTLAGGNYSHAEGCCTRAANYSHAEGYNTQANGNYSHAAGYSTYATQLNYIIGHYNKNGSSGSTSTTSGDAFIIGNGTSSSAQSNAFRVTYTGAAYGLSQFNASGADYAEFLYEWDDGNENNEDRVGYFVTFKDKKLYKATSGDYIIGITSGNPSVVGNADEDYYWKYERDEFNRLIMEDAPEIVLEENEDGEMVEIETGNIIKNGRFKINKNYNPSMPYTERKNRKEWDYVGMLGVLPLRDDGSCMAGQFCKCNNEGIATLAESVHDGQTFMVLERVNEYIVKVLLK